MCLMQYANNKGADQPAHPSSLMQYANNKGADQPAHPRSLISTFVVCCLGSMICILALSRVSRFYLIIVAVQAGMNFTWSKIPEDTFSRDEAQLHYEKAIYKVKRHFIFKQVSSVLEAPQRLGEVRVDNSHSLHMILSCFSQDAASLVL